jgi:hypothetical protein
MSDQTETDDDDTGTVGQAEPPPAFIHVPATVADMVPPRPADAITEASNLLRVHWEEVKPFWQAISGEKPSIHGSWRLDEAACTFKIQEIAQKNGFALLGSLQAERLRRVLRWAYKRNTHIRVGQLIDQNKRLRIEHQHQHQQAAE